MAFNQLAHTRIARGIRSFAEHNADQVPTITAHRGDQVITRRLGIAGLDTVDALHFPQQGIVITDLDAAILETGNTKIAREYGKPLLERTAVQPLLARRAVQALARED